MRRSTPAALVTATVLTSLAALILGTGCAGSSSTLGPGRGSARSGEGPSSIGFASFYGAEFDGRRTASGARFDSDALTAAHRTLPFGTRVRVTNLKNGRSVVVTINDRGPFRRGRVLDVSKRAASDLGFVRAGVARVRLDLLSDG